MNQAMQGQNSEGKILHYSVGAVIEREGKYLLMDRAIMPFGFAGPAGHVDEGETLEQAVAREVQEETGLMLTNHKLLFEEMVEWNECKQGIKGHFWYVYKCETSSEIQRNEESKSMGWFTVDEIKQLKLEPMWKYWFEKMEII